LVASSNFELNKNNLKTFLFLLCNLEVIKAKWAGVGIRDVIKTTVNEVKN
jgi:hypothetical protein